MIVASIRTVWHGEVTPVTGVQQWDYSQTQNITLKRGEEMGSFALGSTVILCTEPEKCGTMAPTTATAFVWARL